MPQLIIRQNGDNVPSTWIGSFSPSTNYSAAKDFIVGYELEFFVQKHYTALLNFDLSDIPSSATIIDATLTISATKTKEGMMAKVETGIPCFDCGERSGIDCAGRLLDEATRCLVCLDKYMNKVRLE